MVEIAEREYSWGKLVYVYLRGFDIVTCQWYLDCIGGYDVYNSGGTAAFHDPSGFYKSLDKPGDAVTCLINRYRALYDDAWSVKGYYNKRDV